MDITQYNIHIGPNQQVVIIIIIVMILGLVHNYTGYLHFFPFHGLPVSQFPCTSSLDSVNHWYAHGLQYHEITCNVVFTFLITNLALINNQQVNYQNHGKVFDQYTCKIKFGPPKYVPPKLFLWWNMNPRNKHLWNLFPTIRYVYQACYSRVWCPTPYSGVTRPGQLIPGGFYSGTGQWWGVKEDTILSSLKSLFVGYA